MSAPCVSRDLMRRTISPVHPSRELGDVLVNGALVLQDIVKQEACIGHVFHKL